MRAPAVSYRYPLRHRFRALVILALVGALALGFSLRAAEGIEPLANGLRAFAALCALSLALVFLRFQSHRYEVTAKGIRASAPLARTRSLAWSEVRELRHRCLGSALELRGEAEQIYLWKDLVGYVTFYAYVERYLPELAIVELPERVDQGPRIRRIKLAILAGLLAVALGLTNPHGLPVVLLLYGALSLLFSVPTLLMTPSAITFGEHEVRVERLLWTQRREVAALDSIGLEVQADGSRDRRQVRLSFSRGRALKLPARVGDLYAEQVFPRLLERYGFVRTREPESLAGGEPAPCAESPRP